MSDDQKLDPLAGDSEYGDTQPEDQQQSADDENGRQSSHRTSPKKAHDNYKKFKKIQDKTRSAKQAAGDGAKQAERVGANAGKIGAGAEEGAAAAGEAAGGAAAAGEGAATAGSAAAGAAAGASTAAAGGVAAAEAGTAGVGAASGATGVGVPVAVAAGAAIAAEEGAKELNRIRKDPSRVFNYDKVLLNEGKKWGIRVAIIVIAIFAFFLFFVMMFGDEEAWTVQQQKLADQYLTVTKTSNPIKVANGEAYSYIITVSAKEGAGDVTINDPLPSGIRYISSTGGSTFQNGTVIWTSKANQLTAPFIISFTITVAPVTNDTYIVNQAHGTVVPQASNAPVPSSGPIPPSTTDCGMPEYRRAMSIVPSHMNYGDPQCTFVKTDPNGNKILDKDKLMTMLKQLDPTRATLWYCLAGPESSYNPNDYLANSTSGRGAYGLYQMNPGGRTGIPGQWDNGNVVWTLQVPNAVNYNNWLITQGMIWDYWDPRSRAKCPGM